MKFAERVCSIYSLSGRETSNSFPSFSKQFCHTHKCHSVCLQIDPICIVSENLTTINFTGKFRCSEYFLDFCHSTRDARYPGFGKQQLRRYRDDVFLCRQPYYILYIFYGSFSLQQKYLIHFLYRINNNYLHGIESFFENLIVSQQVKKFATFHKTPRYITMFTRNSQLSLSSTRSTHYKPLFLFRKDLF